MTKKLNLEKIEKMVVPWFRENFDYNSITPQEKTMISLNIGNGYGIWNAIFAISGETPADAKLLAYISFDSKTGEMTGYFDKTWDDLKALSEQ